MKKYAQWLLVSTLVISMTAAGGVPAMGAGADLVEPVSFTKAIGQLDNQGLYTGLVDVLGNRDFNYDESTFRNTPLRFPVSLLKTSKGLVVLESDNHMARLFAKDRLTPLFGAVTKPDFYGIPMGGMKDGSLFKGEFNKPRDMVMDSQGNYFVTDSKNNCIRKVTAEGISTFAGGKTAGYLDGAGSAARFNNPVGITIDKNDTLYVADSFNNVIRKIEKDGKVTTYAGTGPSAPGASNGQRAKASFNEPQDVLYDQANNQLYVADTGNHLIRLIKADAVSTFAGVYTTTDPATGYGVSGYANGSADKSQFQFPKGLAAFEGGLLVTDSGNNAVRAIKDGIVYTLVGTGEAGGESAPLSTARLNMPSDVLYDSGILYIADTKNSVVRAMKINLLNLGSKNLRIASGGKEVELKGATPVVSGNQMFPVDEFVGAVGGTIESDKAKGTLRVTYLGKAKVLDEGTGLMWMLDKPYAPYRYLKSMFGSKGADYFAPFNLITVGK